jgi:DNA-binding MarR family transcriptional regulator
MSYANDMPTSTESRTPSVTTCAVPTVAECRPATLAAELRVALMHASRRLRHERGSDDITPGQYSVLAVIGVHKAMTPRDLAAHEKVQPPSMTRTIALLESLGLVARQEHPTDRRQVLITLTEDGQAAVKETRRRRDRWLAKRLSELEPEDRATLARAAKILAQVSSS